ncbi:MAG: multiple antibiotic resistance protein [Archaeoglobaceae archaeon]|nr:multiple antibiotic resistance protein [Archaeoglobaceae archaeon]MDK2876466.1 multiple antibiotic resistance protein [Archaeoglobaceae archaeon]
MDYLIYFFKCFLTFFVIVDPPGNLPIFIALTHRFKEELRMRISKRMTIIALSILLVTTVSGGIILEFFQVSINSLRIAGGILLFIISVDILLGAHGREEYRRRAEETAEVDSVAVFPLALPLYTGPGAITAGIVMYSQAFDAVSKLIVVMSAILVYAIVPLTHIYSSWIIKMLGKSGADIVAKVLSIFLAAIGVEFVLEGIRSEFF